MTATAAGAGTAGAGAGPPPPLEEAPVLTPPPCWACLARGPVTDVFAGVRLPEVIGLVLAYARDGTSAYRDLAVAARACEPGLSWRVGVEVMVVGGGHGCFSTKAFRREPRFWALKEPEGSSDCLHQHTEPRFVPLEGHQTVDLTGIGLYRTLRGYPGGINVVCPETRGQQTGAGHVGRPEWHR